ncbi:hypothetical protein K438DRAFT_180354 [Mycena galopus ATCC 62051]|nr:hypothetical protein K438DRAFT_180354 [Mycena galopus ATCC 62051]
MPTVSASASSSCCSRNSTPSIFALCAVPHSRQYLSARIPLLCPSPAIHIALAMREARNCVCRSCHSHPTAPAGSLASTSRSRREIASSAAVARTAWRMWAHTAEFPLSYARRGSRGQTRAGRTYAIRRRGTSNGQRMGKEHACRVVVSREGGVAFDRAPRRRADLSSAAHVHSGRFEEGGAPGVCFEEERVRHGKREMRTSLLEWARTSVFCREGLMTNANVQRSGGWWSPRPHDAREDGGFEGGVHTTRLRISTPSSSCPGSMRTHHTRTPHRIRLLSYPSLPSPPSSPRGSSPMPRPSCHASRSPYPHLYPHASKRKGGVCAQPAFRFVGLLLYLRSCGVENGRDVGGRWRGSRFVLVSA